MYKTKPAQGGFTLIELMIVVAIIGIIAGIAYPSYMESVRKSNRADAKAELSDVAQRLQRCFTAYSAFNHDSCAVYKAISGGNKITSREGMYRVSGDVKVTTFSLIATPAVGSVQAMDSKCAAFNLNQAGIRSSNSSGLDANNCW